jgi:hypothetical protein
MRTIQRPKTHQSFGLLDPPYTFMNDLVSVYPAHSFYWRPGSSLSAPPPNATSFSAMVPLDWI